MVYLTLTNWLVYFTARIPYRAKCTHYTMFSTKGTQMISASIADAGFGRHIGLISSIFLVPAGKHIAYFVIRRCKRSPFSV
jgi:hypothetical protein